MKKKDLGRSADANEFYNVTMRNKYVCKEERELEIVFFSIVHYNVCM